MNSVLSGSVLVWIAIAPLIAANGPLGPASGLLDRATAVNIIAGAKPARIALERVEPQRCVDGRFLALTITGSAAPAIRVRLSKFHLPAQATVYVYGIENGLLVDQYGPFIGSGPTGSAQFWTPAIRGRVYVELQVAAEFPATLPFEIDAVAPVDANRTHAAAVHDGARPDLFEGDILIDASGARPIKTGGRSLFGLREPQSIGISGAENRWPGGVLPYEIDTWMPDQYRIIAAIDHWNTLLDGVVRLVPHTSEANYIVFKHPLDAGRCASWVGMLGTGAQSIDFGDYCGIGNAIHEIGHAFGLWHEQSREDRDRHIRILWNNIMAGMELNFKQMIETGDDLGDYDFGSIMHYNAYAFSSNGMPTIETIPAGISIGQREQLSRGDIEGIKALYPRTGRPNPIAPAPAPTPRPVPVPVTISSNPDQITLVVDGSQIVAPATMAWTEGSEHSIAAPEFVENTGERSHFLGWSDGGELSHNVIAPSSATMYAATYERSYELSAATVDEAAGSVSVSPQSENGFYAENATVTVSATALPGYCFAGWQGLISGTPAEASIAMTQPYTLTANFQPGSYTLTRTFDYAPQDGGEFRIGIETNDGCTWKAQSSASWLSVRTADPASGSGVIDVSFEANDTGRPRIGRITVADRTWTVMQSGR